MGMIDAGIDNADLHSRARVLFTANGGPPLPRLYQVDRAIQVAPEGWEPGRSRHPWQTVQLGAPCPRYAHKNNVHQRLRRAGDADATVFQNPSQTVLLGTDALQFL